MAVLWELEPATAAKHRLYRRYLDAWWPVLLQPSQRNGARWRRVTFLDAFAGPGRYVGGEEGSPVFTLDRLLNHTAVERMALSPGRVCLVFTERDRARYEHLREELTSRFGSLRDLPVRVEVHCADARDSESLLTRVGAWGNPILAIFDSWGNVGVPLSLAARIAHNRSSEVITTFGPNWFNRREKLDADVLDSVFGGRAHWAEADRETSPEERWRAWLATYRSALQRAGFKYRLQFQVVPRTGQPLYLVFGTGHEKGVDVMKEAMWEVDGSDGMSFKDPRTRGAPLEGQQSLFEADGVLHPELQELVLQRLHEGPATIEELQRWLLLETSRWRPTHAREAASFLGQEGVVMTVPAGRLTKNSRLYLRA
jgi:three-Cys-motif partner protein